jgi:hypothetical protein
MEVCDRRRIELAERRTEEKAMRKEGQTRRETSLRPKVEVELELGGGLYMWRYWYLAIQGEAARWRAVEAII